MIAKIKCIQCHYLGCSHKIRECRNAVISPLFSQILLSDRSIYHILSAPSSAAGIRRVQDNLFALKFTDVDYRVLTDAARFVLDGESPFARPTYRYSPLLAPNHQVFSSFGKVVFVLCDLLVGLLIHLMLSARGLRRTKITFPVALWLLTH